MTTARERQLPATRVQRDAQRNTNARRFVMVRPLGTDKHRVREIGCAVDLVAGSAGTRSPDSILVGVNAFGQPQLSILRAEPPGFAGRSTFGFDEEAFTLTADPSIVATIPEFFFVGSSNPGTYLIGFELEETPLDTVTLIVPGSTEEVPIPDTLATIANLSFVTGAELDGLALGPGAQAFKADIDVDAGHPAAPFGAPVSGASLSFDVRRADA